jgi:neutral ceramidase
MHFAARVLLPSSAMPYEIGVGKRDITAWKPGLGMMGWGMLGNYATRVATPLSARAYVIVDPTSGDRVAMAVCELAFISTALREAVCERLRQDDRGLDLHNVMLMATHTHSGPGGFTHYAFYNVTIPGFSQDVLDGLADGIAAAIREADDTRVPATIRWAASEIPRHRPVAWNRSVTAYNLNDDVAKLTPADADVALDRTMRLLRFDAVDGRALGAINWFAVHCTSVHSDNHALHFDNKGYAAAGLEAELRGTADAGPVTAFAQGASGDVTPNTKRHRGKPFVRGELPDDDASARDNGAIQAEHARTLWREAAGAPALPVRLRHAHRFVDMGDVAVDPRFVRGQSGMRTAPGEIGMAMFFGTEEGPGLPRALVGLQKVIATLRRDASRDPGHAASQAEKVTWVDGARRRLLGFAALDRLPRLPLPRRVAEAARMLRALPLDDAADLPWTPQVLPIQLVILGDVALIAIAHELTTVAGRRLCASVLESLASQGISRAVLVGYANAYGGYVTTPEEYALQDYEGASTHFGKWTLPAYQTVFADLAATLCGRPARIAAARPPSFARDHLAHRAFAG